ncbi:hypothetical protein MAQ5080_01145 [Marinomonas aquimarina]|uniref:DUF748 domain-containing protein n=1 Tax=Marinomonas aquimarina TaxID=295068 RepID=A0A1A8T8B4_9GAMM|nr:DUF748 domain-containing protein [Marinomonas aquimarina]SBS28598.1 hypothetical protein MAQ5080_01145 [Marinomonas aquimarina]
MTKLFTQLKPWQKKTLITTVALLITLTVLWALIPTITKWLANRYLEPHQAEFSAAEINPDLFPIGLSLFNVAISQQDQTTFTLEQLSIGLDFWPLFTGAFHVNHILIDGFNMQVEQRPEGWVVAGIPTYSSDSAQQEEVTAEEDQAGSVPPTFFVRNASIKDTSVNLTTEKGDDRFAIDNLNITEVSHDTSIWRGIFDIEASINNGTAVLAGDIRADKEQVNADVNLGNLQLSSTDVAHFLPAGLGRLSANGLQLEGQTQTIYRFNDSPMLSFTAPLITIDSQDFTLEEAQQTITWQSLNTSFADLSVDMIDTDTLQIESNSALSLDDLRMESEEQRLDFGNLRLNNNLKLSKTADTLQLEQADTQLTLEQSHLKSGANSVQLAQFTTQLNDVTATLLLSDFTGSTAGNITLAANTVVGQLAQGQDFDLQALSISSPIQLTLEQEDRSLVAPQFKVSLNNGQFSGNDLVAQLDTLTLALENTQIKQDNSSLSLSTQSQLNSDNVRVLLNQIAEQQPPTSVNYNQLTVSSDIEWQQNNEQSTLAASQNSLTLSNLGVEQANTLTGLLQTLQLNSDQIRLGLNNNGLEQLAVQNNQLHLGALASTLSDGSALLNWKDVSINSSNIAMIDAGITAQIESFQVQEFLASKPNSEQPQPALAAFDQLNASNIQLAPNGVTIDKVSLDKLLSGIALAEDRSIANLVLPDYLQTTPASEQENKTEPKAGKPDTPEQEAAFYAVVHQIQVSPESQFIFSDHGIKPPLSRVLDIEQLTIENLNTRDLNEQMHVVLRAKDGEYATIDSDIKMTPAANRLTMEAQATIREVELPPISPYVASALGYDINAGQLNMDLNLKSNQGVLDGNSHIVLRQFDLGGKTDSNAVLKAGAIPLNLAVDTLKNRDNNIVLDLPMKGDIENPNFHWQNFFMLPIRQGLFKASSTYLMQTFIPYANVITLVQFAGEQVLRLRVEPLQFALDEEDITAPEQEAFLDQMIKLMKDRKDAELKACGVSVVRDINDEITYQLLSEADRADLLALANRRAESLKRYLVDNGIASSRVFLCTPSIDEDKNALPHVTFTF